MTNVIIISPEDNIGVVIEEIKKGDALAYQDRQGNEVKLLRGCCGRVRDAAFQPAGRQGHIHAGVHECGLGATRSDRQKRLRPI